MFKCKIDISEFDKSDKKTPKVELAKAKNIAKAGVKKMAGKSGEKTNFFLSKDFFENKGKPVGHFLAFGISKKLSKQFVMKEMKGKGECADPKNAATGEVCVKNVDGKDKLVFEPHAKSKIPAGQWPKLLKSLKMFFAGYKAVVAIDGKMIEEEALLPGEVEEVDTDSGEEIVFEDEVVGVAEEDTEDAAADAPNTAADLPALQAEIKGIIDAVKTFSTTEMAAVKATPNATTILAAWKKGQEIASKIAAWVASAAPNATALAKEIAAANAAKDSVAKIIAQLQPSMDKINVKQSEKSVGEMDTMATEIAAKIADLMKSFGTDVEKIPGIKELMSAIQ